MSGIKQWVLRRADAKFVAGGCAEEGLGVGATFPDALFTCLQFERKKTVVRMMGKLLRCG